MSRLFGEHNGHPRAISEVSIDMSPAYIAGVRENLGDQAVVVFDKFHVIMHADQAVMKPAGPNTRSWIKRSAISSSRRAGSCSKTPKTIRPNYRPATRGC